MAKASLLILAAIFLGVITPSCLSDNILYSGETLSTGEFLNYGSFVFIMQEDCNLVLYDVDKPIWATNTGGLSRSCFLSMQTDGNLVVYNPSNKPIWASNTGGQNGNYVCILQKDRNVVIYGTDRWATGTHTGLVGIPASPPSEKYPTAGKIKLVTAK
uniref:Mannose-specific lectin n=2 Tax=Galanthus nivalis TaxID=4670 RepID=LEC_GALNI|nr:RecName: Full=Mannose-specific lectin; AltName: Full=Agglutinin; AltName: Full=LecGNA 2; AltName: Full=Snowdrop lectin; Flags: Precursor [Galanthus nivalis]AAA33346.1 lectin [Galanthus nivalis]